MARAFRVCMSVIAVVGVLVALGGCGGPRPDVTPPTGDPGDKAQTPPDTARRDEGRDVMVLVNGKALSMDELIDSLLRGPGLAYADQLVRCELVNQALAKAGMTLTEEDMKVETESIMKLMVPQAQTPAERLQVLDRMLAQEQVPFSQWVLGVRVSASLRRLAEGRIKITDAMLKTEFGRLYGRQVIVRVIEVASIAKAREVLAALKAGKKFEKLAWSTSIHASSTNGGLLDPITANTRGVPPAILQTALSLKNPGDVSDLIQVEATFFIMQLDESIQPKNVKYEKVLETIRESLKGKLLRFHQKAVLDEITRDGRVEYVNPVLRELTEKKKAGK